MVFCLWCSPFKVVDKDIFLDRRCLNWRKKALFAPSAAHYDLVFPDFETFKRFFSPDPQRFPGNVYHLPGVLVDEMVVPLDVRIEHHNPLYDRLRLEEAFLGK
jgi:hypothetical protein